ncbi:MAG: hypothetical protein GWN58_50285, partial [Anaerolineae bacterium]|nr:hypothetical protein [Anaerolineae bacterium]
IARQGLAALLLVIFSLPAPSGLSVADEGDIDNTSEELRQLRSRIDHLRREVAKTRNRHDKERN